MFEPAEFGVKYFYLFGQVFGGVWVDDNMRRRGGKNVDRYNEKPTAPATINARTQILSSIAPSYFDRMNRRFDFPAFAKTSMMLSRLGLVLAFDDNAAQRKPVIAVLGSLAWVVVRVAGS